MNGPVKFAALQMVSGGDIDANLAQAERLIQSAAQADAKLVLLPENFALMSTRKLYAAGVAERSTNGPIRRFIADTARRYGLWIVAGSVPISARPNGTDLDDRVRAACIVCDPEGVEVARYDKIHLFDVDVSDKHGSYRESRDIEPGESTCVVEIPFAKLGLSICYDLRFPELYRLLLNQGAEVLLVPAAFTAATGKAHWEVLLRARAIENLCYVIGAGQGGQHSASRETWGHSMVIDPWGRILAEHPQGEGMALAEIDLSLSKQLRRDMPVIGHRRL